MQLCVGIEIPLAGAEGGKFIVNKTFDASLIYFHFNVLTKSKDLTIGLQQCVTELRVVLLPL